MLPLFNNFQAFAKGFLPCGYLYYGHLYCEYLQYLLKNYESSFLNTNVNCIFQINFPATCFQAVLFQSLTNCCFSPHQTCDLKDRCTSDSPPHEEMPHFKNSGVSDEPIEYCSYCVLERTTNYKTTKRNIIAKDEYLNVTIVYFDR